MSVRDDVLEIAAWGLHDDAGDSKIYETEIFDDGPGHSAYVEFAGETTDGREFTGKFVLVGLEVEDE